VRAHGRQCAYIRTHGRQCEHTVDSACACACVCVRTRFNILQKACHKHEVCHVVVQHGGRQGPAGGAGLV
jgi:hypothetical protein